MGIIQENRVDAPHPAVKETDYGAVYVESGTEHPVVEESAGVAEEPVGVEVSVDVARPKKKVGRKKKNA